jgi:[acyl-carrier-protein] S-malonyltransferase
MGRELYDASAAAKGVFDAADRALPGLLDLMWAGPDQALQLTENQQPALVAAGAAAYAAYLERGGRPAVIGAGHSLGEYTAHVAAGSLTIEDAVLLVRARGRYMQDAVAEGAGAMAAILKLETAVIEETLASVMTDTGSAGELVAIANLNAPGQTVISGTTRGVELAVERLKELGARAIPLKVSAPFHCTLMTPAADRLSTDLHGARFADPTFDIVSNVTARPVPSPADAAGLLIEQVTSTVRWVECMRFMAAQADTGSGVKFIEFGSGEVLTNLARRILQDPDAVAVTDAATLEEVSDATMA